MLQVIVTVLHVLASLVLILVVLLQTGKRADLAGAFGGGGSQTAFGARGAATMLSKLTTACAIIFMITAISLSVMASRQGSGASALDSAPVETSAPVDTEQAAPDAVPPGDAIEDTSNEAEGETPSE